MNKTETRSLPLFCPPSSVEFRRTLRQVARSWPGKHTSGTLILSVLPIYLKDKHTSGSLILSVLSIHLKDKDACMFFTSSSFSTSSSHHFLQVWAARLLLTRLSQPICSINYACQLPSLFSTGRQTSSSREGCKVVPQDKT